MMMTTMGSQYWPQTPEGRVATIASFFVAGDRDSTAAQLRALRRDVAALRRARNLEPPAPRRREA